MVFGAVGSSLPVPDCPLSPVSAPELVLVKVTYGPALRSFGGLGVDDQSASSSYSTARAMARALTGIDARLVAYAGLALALSCA